MRVRSNASNSTLALGIVLFLPQPMTTAAQSSLRGSEKSHEFALMREYGIKRNSDNVPDLIAAMDSATTYSTDVNVPLLALARIGDGRALPAIDRLLARNATSYARVARARIVAMTAAHEVSDPGERARVYLSRMLSETGMTVQAVNAGLRRPQPDRSHPVEPIELVVMRAVSDMVYQSKDTALRNHVIAAGFDLAADMPSAVKIEQALKSSVDRAEFLIDTLAAKRVLRGNDFYLIQLAADERLATADTVLRKLAEMRNKRSDYTYTGFSAMFSVLQAIGDKAHTGLLEDFSKDSDGKVVYYANQALMTVRKGHRVQWLGVY